MLKNNRISEFSFTSEILIEDWLRQDLGISRSKLKEFHFKKNWLGKCTHKQETLTFLLDVLNFNLINPVFTGAPLKILHIDENLVTLAKPAGMHLYPLQYSETATVLNFLRGQNFGSDILQVAFNTHEKGALYRVDSVTSGLMMFARNEAIYNDFRHHLERRKYYLAIAHGQVVLSGHHRHFISGLSKGGARVKCSTDASPEGVEANIDIIPLVYNAELNLSLLGVTLGEGHRHQIRVQLAKIGHPILGDALYGGQTHERVFLHAWAYGFGSQFFCDDTCPLFGQFFDLNRGLQMFRDHCGISK